MISESPAWPHKTEVQKPPASWLPPIKTSRYLNCLSSVVLPDFCLPANCVLWPPALLISFSLFFPAPLKSAGLWRMQGLVIQEKQLKSYLVAKLKKLEKSKFRLKLDPIQPSHGLR